MRDPESGQCRPCAAIGLDELLERAAHHVATDAACTELPAQKGQHLVGLTVLDIQRLARMVLGRIVEAIEPQQRTQSPTRLRKRVAVVKREVPVAELAAAGK